MLAIRAASSCNANALMQDIVRSAIADEKMWPTTLIPTVFEECLPSQFSLKYFECLVRRGGSAKKELDRLQSAVEYVGSVVQKDHLPELIELCRRLIESTTSGSSRWELTSANVFLIEPLAHLCERAFEELPPSESVLIACGLIFQFQPHLVSIDTTLREALRSHVAAAPTEHRGTLFWYEFNNAIAGKPTDSSSLRNGFVYHSILRPYTQMDRAWIQSALADTKRTNLEREIALRLWHSLWRHDGESKSDLDQLDLIIQDLVTLRALLAELTKPPPKTSNDDWEKKVQARRRRDERQQNKNEQDWIAYKEKLMKDPDEGFAEPRLHETVNSLCMWLHRRPRARDSSLGLNSWRDVRNHFGEIVANRFEDALRAHWRTTPRKLRSTLTVEQSRQIESDLVNAFTGLLIETSAEGWATRLSSEEASIATEWATLELNHFPDWINAVATEHTDAVCRVCISELKHEINSFQPGTYPQILSMIKRCPRSIQIAAAPTVYEAITFWIDERDSVPPHSGKTYAGLLQELIELLVQVDFRRDELRALSELRYRDSPASEEGLIWLQCVAATDLSRVVHVVKPVVDAQSETERHEYGKKVISMMFGRRDYARIRISLDANATTLRDLVVLAYELVSPALDPRHEGSYSPSVHDDAVIGRGALMSALANTSGEATYRVLRGLANDTLFSSRKGCLDLMVRQRAANDSEWPSQDGNEFKNWLSRFEAPPKNIEELFRLVGERLEDIQDELRNHDFSQRLLLVNDKEEKHFQLFIADRLHRTENDVYSVIREEEVADNKKPDIRIAARDFDRRVTVEIKVGDRYTVRQLEQAVEEQLSGKYLRDKRCKAGYLLIIYGGWGPSFKHPKSRKNMSIEDTVLYLRDKAKSLSRASGGEKIIDVFALDLRSGLSLKN